MGSIQRETGGRFGRLWLLLVMVVVTGCASTVEIDSEPRGASVEVDGRHVGETPTTYSDAATVFATRELVVEKKGYEPVETTLARNGELNDEALVTGLVGIVVWPLLPAWLWILEYPSSVHYELTAAEVVAMQNRFRTGAAPRVERSGNTVTFVLEPRVQIDSGRQYFDFREAFVGR